MTVLLQVVYVTVKGLSLCSLGKELSLCLLGEVTVFTGHVCSLGNHCVHWVWGCHCVH